jgi:hypothetical protein
MPDPIVDISKDIVSRSVKLSREISAFGIVGQRSGEDAVRADTKAQEILRSKFFPSKYESVEQMKALRDDPNGFSDNKRNAETSLRDLSTALFLAEPRMGEWLLTGQVDKNLPESFAGISEVIAKNWLMDGESDTVGGEIVKKLSELEVLNRRAAMAPSIYGERKKKAISDAAEFLLGIFDGLSNPDSESGRKLGAVVGYLDSEIGPSDSSTTAASTADIKEAFREVMTEQTDRVVLGLDQLKEKIGERTLVDKEASVERVEKAVESAADAVEGTDAELEAIYNSLKNDEKVLNSDEKEIGKARDRFTASAAKRAKMFVSEGRVPRGRGPESAEKEGYTVEQIFSLIKKIEDSGRESTDITYNSNHARALDDIVNGSAKISGEVDDRTKKWIKDHIKMSLLANDWYLSASISTTVEDMMKMSMRVHQGDVEHTLDQDFLGHFLNREKRLSGIPSSFRVAEAWDLRQEAYFKYITEVKKINGKNVVTDGLLYKLWNKYSTGEGGNRYIEVEVDGVKMRLGQDKFLDAGSPAVKANPDFGVDKDLYTNLRLETATLRGKIVKELMAQEISRTGVDIAMARRSVELARRLSALTYIDSLANITFIDGDDYAELLNFKLIRYADQVEAASENENKAYKQKEGPKNKPTGYGDTIKYIDSLTPSWLQTLLTESAVRSKGRKVYSPVYSGDIDFENMTGKSAMHYHLASIVMKKVLPAQQMFLKGLSLKDFESFQDLQRKYDQLNKTMTEAADKGWDLLNLEQNQMDQSTSLAVKERKFRAFFIMSVLGIAIDSEGAGWGVNELNKLERFVTENKFYGNDGKKSVPFIPHDYWDWITKDTAVVINKYGRKVRVKGFGLGVKLADLEQRYKRGK